MHLKQFFVTTRIFRININDKISGHAMVRPASSDFWKPGALSSNSFFRGFLVNKVNGFAWGFFSSS